MTPTSHPQRTTSQLHIVDVFAERKYAGNQLAVVSGAPVAEADMQRVARETNFSETTFILSDQPHDGGYDVRIFTPTAEIPFAGHPTIGTAWVLRNEVLRSNAERVVLNLKIGPVPVTFEHERDGRDLLWMSTPYPEFGQTFATEPLAALLGLEPADVDERSPIEEVSLGVPFTFVPLRNLDAVQRARFRNDQYERLQYLGFNPCIYVFCRETYEAAHQLNARMFAETFGIKEDPATGSATACLAAYLLRHRVYDSDRIDLKVEQGYEILRPSLLYLRAERRDDGAEIRVGGHVVPSISGSLL